MAILEDTPGSKKKSPRSLVEFDKGRGKPVVQWYNRGYANSLFGTDQMEAKRGMRLVEEIGAQGQL